MRATLFPNLAAVSVAATHPHVDRLIGELTKSPSPRACCFAYCLRWSYVVMAEENGVTASAESGYVAQREPPLSCR
jgi:hypothetical protein